MLKTHETALVCRDTLAAIYQRIAAIQTSKL